MTKAKIININRPAYACFLGFCLKDQAEYVCANARKFVPWSLILFLKEDVFCQNHSRNPGKSTF